MSWHPSGSAQLSKLQMLYEAIALRISALGLTWPTVCGHGDPGAPVAGCWRGWSVYRDAIKGLAPAFCADPNDPTLPAYTWATLCAAAFGADTWRIAAPPRCGHRDFDFNDARTLLNLLVYPMARASAFNGDFFSDKWATAPEEEFGWSDVMDADPEWGTFGYLGYGPGILLSHHPTSGHAARLPLVCRTAAFGGIALWLSTLTAGVLRAQYRIREGTADLPCPYMETEFACREELLSPLTDVWEAAWSHIAMVPGGTMTEEWNYDVDEVVSISHASPYLRWRFSNDTGPPAPSFTQQGFWFTFDVVLTKGNTFTPIP